MRRLFTVLGIVAASCAVAAASAQATSPRHGHIHGIAFAQHQAGVFSGNNLTYHGGPVMPTNQVYTIFWDPSGYSVDTSGAGYNATIDSYFKNVAHDNGFSTNVYWAGTQYYETTSTGTQNVSYNSSFVNEIDDPTPYPANGCRDSDTSVCLTDAQIQTEIQNVVAAHSLPTGSGTEYFLLTPKNVGSCFDSSNSECAYTYYCAYHSNFADRQNGQQILYANVQYANFVPSACGSGQKPNGNDADATINLISHEHNETITDPFGNAWYDFQGNEDGDKCAWNFGSRRQVFGPSGAKYNETINSAHYYLQQEWSNSRSGCVLSGL